MARLVSELDIQQFAMDGVVCLRGVFSQHWVDLVRRGIDANMAAPSPFGESLKDNENEGAYFDDYCNWEKIPEFKNFIMESPAAEIAGRLMESQEAAIYHEHVLNKEPGTAKRTPWHHDQSYYPIDGSKVCSIWMPVDPVPLETAISFVRGSHLWNAWFYPRKFATEQRYPLSDGSGAVHRRYEDVPSDEIDSGQHELLAWPMEPGDCIVFHMKTVHGAPGNASQSSHRRVLSTRWLGDDTVITTRPWDVSPPLLAPLRPGDRAISKYFPVIWRRTEQPEVSLKPGSHVGAMREADALHL
ncbi:uncharacterized protein LOC119099199 [Pollicipes pollicipes]|uniref:uncharacterized protein LOC119099199 n=1 Tax=Pollicipes pollicipes TaxID=41117 RepID=UPI001885157E|nr:uncharacterized protein LOC119099199 [Pollicipes pollicipes]